jgi:HEAT repeat protein
MNVRSRTPRTTRRNCLVALLLAAGFVGCGSGKSERLLIELNSSDVAIRRNAARLLAETTPADERTAGALTAALEDTDEEVRRWSAQGLGAIGASSSQLRLETVLKDRATPVRRAAAFALQKLVPDSTAYRAELIAAMKSGDGGVIVALARMQPPPQWATATLLELLKDKRPGIRRLAAEALGNLSVGDPAVWTALEKLSQGDLDDRVREAAEKSLQPRRTG